MKKILFLICSLTFTANVCWAKHTIPEDAANIKRGILPNARLDATSVTLRGNAPLLVDGERVIFSSHLAGGIIGGGALGNEVVFATNAKKGVAGGLMPDNASVIFSSHISIGAGSLHNSTATLTTRINNLDNSTTTLTNRINQLAIDTGTLKLQDNNTNYVSITGDTMTGALTIQNSLAVNNSGNTLTFNPGGGIVGSIQIGGNDDFNIGRTGAAGTSRKIVLDGLQGTVILNSLSLSSYSITGVAEPNGNQDAATKNYVDTQNSTQNIRIDNSTATLTNRTNQIAIDTGTLTNRVNQIAIDTGTLTNRVNQIAIDTGSIKSGQSPFRVIVGTLGAIGVDISSGNTDGLNAALERLGARGLSLSATGAGSIFFKEGSYSITNATIPAGVTIFAQEGSSTVFMRAPGDATTVMLTIYGSLIDIQVDMGKGSYSGPKIVAKSNSRITNIRIFNNDGMDINANNTSPFSLIDATNSIISGELLDYRGGVQDQSAGGIIVVKASSFCIVNLRASNGVFGTTGKQGILIERSKDITIDGVYNDCGSRMVLVRGPNEDIKIKGQYFITQAYANSGLIIFDNAGGTVTETAKSSGCVVSGEFIHNVADTDPIIGLNVTPVSVQSGVTITNVIARGVGTNSPNLFSIGSSVFGTVVSNVRAFNMGNPCFVNSGIQSRITGNDVFCDGEEQ